MWLCLFDLQDTKVGAVTVLIALVSHKWVESIALSARCLKAGANWWCAPRLPGVPFLGSPFSCKVIACPGFVAFWLPRCSGRALEASLRTRGLENLQKFPFL